MTRVLLLLAASCLSVATASAQEKKIDRTIGKEPIYKTKTPKYGLLVFGAAEHRVWMVLDGDTLYVDRNGNGDLTDPDEKIAANSRKVDPVEDGYIFEVPTITVGGRTHKWLTASFTPLKRRARFAKSYFESRADLKAILEKAPEAFAVDLRADVDVPGLKGGGSEGRVGFATHWVDSNGAFLFADSPARAPVVRLDGPLQVDFFCGAPKRLRVGRSSEVSVVVGTPGDGPGTFAMLIHEEAIPDGLKPKIHATMPSADGKAALEEDWTIEERC